MSQPSLTGRETLQIRSFRVVFSLERRLFKVDRFRLPFAYGVPLRAIAYAAAALAAVAVAARLPILGAPLTLVPPPVRFVAVPFAVAAVMTRVRVDGLPAHRAAGLWLAHHATPRTLIASRLDRTPVVSRVSDPLTFLPDASGPRLRAATITGPATLEIGVPARGRIVRDTMILAHDGDGALRRPRRLRMPTGMRAVVRDEGAPPT